MPSKYMSLHICLTFIKQRIKINIYLGMYWEADNIYHQFIFKEALQTQFIFTGGFLGDQIRYKKIITNTQFVFDSRTLISTLKFLR